MVVDADLRQFLRHRVHLGRHSLEGAAVDGHEQVEAALTPEPPHGQQVAGALEEVELAERIDVGGGDGVVAGLPQHAHKRDHRAERIPVRAEMPGDEYPLRAVDQLRDGPVCLSLV